MKSSAPPVPLHFLVPGFSKCGTTTLCALLAKHPQLFIPSGWAKEPHFWGSLDLAQRWSQYAELFSGTPSGTLLGEGSQSYSGFGSEVRARKAILELYPHIKLIFIARDPIDRIESSFREFHHHGERYGHRAPFQLYKALQKFPQIIEDSRFFTRINNYRDHMPADQILVIFLEDLISKPNQILAQCFQFLNVNPSVRIDKPHLHLNKASNKLYDTPEFRQMRKVGHNPETVLPSKKLPRVVQDRILEKLGLRKRFTGEPLGMESSGRNPSR